MIEVYNKSLKIAIIAIIFFNFSCHIPLRDFTSLVFR